MTTREALNRLEEMRDYFTGCYLNASVDSGAKRIFGDYVIALDIAWMALHEAEDDGK